MAVVCAWRQARKGRWFGRGGASRAQPHGTLVLQAGGPRGLQQSGSPIVYSLPVALIVHTAPVQCRVRSTQRQETASWFTLHAKHPPAIDPALPACQLRLCTALDRPRTHWAPPTGRDTFRPARCTFGRASKSRSSGGCRGQRCLLKTEGTEGTSVTCQEAAAPRTRAAHRCSSQLRASVGSSQHAASTAPNHRTPLCAKP